MKKLINYILIVTLFISFFDATVCTGFIFFCELFGYDKGNTFLEFINFPLNDDGVILAGYICVAVNKTKKKFRCVMIDNCDSENENINAILTRQCTMSFE